MLVIIVSLGFGIIKPRLGPMLHRIVGVGALYFILATVDAFVHVDTAMHDVDNKTLLFTQVHAKDKKSVSNKNHRSHWLFWIQLFAGGFS